MAAKKPELPTQLLRSEQAVAGLAENSLVMSHLAAMLANKANLNPIELADKINDRIEGDGKEGFLLGLKEHSNSLYNGIMQAFAAARVLSKQLQAQQQNANSIAPPKPGFGPSVGGPHGSDDE